MSLCRLLKSSNRIALEALSANWGTLTVYIAAVNSASLKWNCKCGKSWNFS